MSALSHDPVLQAYALSASLVALSLYAVGFFTAKTRADRKVVVNPEDAGLNRNAQVAEHEHAEVLRIKRAHQNALENAVPFFALGLLYTMTSPSPTLARALFGTFVIARLLHAVFYLKGVQPFRTLTFVIGAVVNMTLLVLVVLAAV